MELFRKIALLFYLLVRFNFWGSICFLVVFIFWVNFIFDANFIFGVVLMFGVVFIFGAVLIFEVIFIFGVVSIFEVVFKVTSLCTESPKIVSATRSSQAKLCNACNSRWQHRKIIKMQIKHIYMKILTLWLPWWK